MDLFKNSDACFYGSIKDFSLGFFIEEEPRTGLKVHQERKKSEREKSSLVFALINVFLFFFSLQN